MNTLHLNRRTLAPIHCASTDSTRYNINSLHVEADGTTVATNGHLLAICRPGSPLEGGDSLEPFEIELSALAPLVKEQRKKTAEVAEVNREQTNANGHVRIETPDGASELKKHDGGEYPNWKQVLPEGDVTCEFNLNLTILEQLVATARQFSGSKKGDMVGVKFSVRDTEALQPIVASYSKGEKEDSLEVVMMPMKN